jgi:excisionase family DNA binding protein
MHDTRSDIPPDDPFPRRRPGDPVPLMTPAEAAAALHVDANTLARWSKTGKLTAVRTPGGHRRYLTSEVARMLRRDDRSRPRTS